MWETSHMERSNQLSYVTCVYSLLLRQDEKVLQISVQTSKWESRQKKKDQQMRVASKRKSIVTYEISGPCLFYIVSIYAQYQVWYHLIYSFALNQNLVATNRWCWEKQGMTIHTVTQISILCWMCLRWEWKASANVQPVPSNQSAMAKKHSAINQKPVTAQKGDLFGMHVVCSEADVHALLTCCSKSCRSLWCKGTRHLWI